MNEINILNVETAVDERGYLRFSNSFDLTQYVRFYDVINWQSNFIRAWHGHKHEAKAALIREGSVMICLVKVDNWESPSKELKITKYFLSDKNPKILEIPSGYAHGFMSLEPNTKVTFYSDKKLDNSLEDDYRFDYNFWDPWKIIFK
jgi:dTDP-4-dehydrorhamnose 3,5-epimerase-like enzyme